jgi:hypothetical protein
MAKRATPRKKVSSAWSWQLKIQLLDVTPVLWRRLIVPSAIKLSDLHQVFQTALGWTNSHLHEFVINGVRYTSPDPDFDDEIGHVDEEGVLLDYALGMDTRCFDYVYDFGDDWHHVILVEDQHIQSESSQSFHCIEGENACPPEDVGGALRYAEFLAAIADPNHEEHESLQQWSGGQFDPKRFDIEAVNRALATVSEASPTSANH